MESWFLSLLSGLIGAIIGGCLSAWGAVKAVRAIQSDLENDELRRQRVDCFVRLMGLRFTITEDSSVKSVESCSQMMFELNRAPALWSANPKILSLIRDVISGQTPENIVRLLREISNSMSINFDGLSDDDLKKIFIVKPRNLE